MIKSVEFLSPFFIGHDLIFEIDFKTGFDGVVLLDLFVNFVLFGS
jgi:hypothetical protein